jgi:hypothetical protein
MNHIPNPIKWIKTHWTGSILSFVTGISIPVLDLFVDIWDVLGKIRPIDGFPLWLIIIVTCLLVIELVALLISGKLNKPAFLLKENIRSWIKYSIIALVMLLSGILVSGLNTLVKNKHDKQLFEECMDLEAKYFNDGSHGLREFYARDYGAAYDSLKIYCNSDPVSACYYAEIIFDGLWKGVEQHETTNAIRLLDSAANLQFYRAIFKMEDYYYRQNMKEEAMQYAEQLLRVSSHCDPREIFPSDSAAKMQVELWSSYCGESYTRLLDYYIENSRDRDDLRNINDIYYHYAEKVLELDNEFVATRHEYRDIWVEWQLGYRSSAERQAKRAVKKYPGNPLLARLYASILVNFNNISSTTDSLRLQEAEKVLVEALKGTSQRALSDPYPDMNEQEMYNVSWMLSELYDSTGYWMEAAEMEHLATAYMLMNKYRAYETKSK